MYKSNISSAKLLHRGKVRDIYEHGENLLIVATDRVSAFDFILHETIPDKGRILNALSAFWFDLLKDDVENHIITTNCKELPEELQAESSELEGRFMYVKKTEPVKVEAIVRGYITGSGWKNYQQEGSICGISLPDGMKESERFSTPLFTPTTKAEVGDHDENMNMKEVENLIGKERAKELHETAVKLYNKANAFAETKGLILADTKLEFGIIEGRMILIDECFTPDSSRYWLQEEYAPGKPQNPYDKQVIRDYLLSTNWDRKSPPPHIPNEIIERARLRYLDVYQILTGKHLKNHYN